MQLYVHPFSSYSQKVLIALYENATPFTYRRLGPEDPQAFAELTTLWPLKRFPVLDDKGRTIVEATAIIEYLTAVHRGPVPMIPDDAVAAVETRMLDRFFDNYVMTPVQKIVGDALRPEAKRDAQGVADARATLDVAYRWLDARIADRQWADGRDFSLADCAAAPSLFYADWTHPIDDAAFPHVRAYRNRLLARPTVARCVDEGRPYRKLFPLGAPDRD